MIASDKKTAGLSALPSGIEAMASATPGIKRGKIPLNVPRYEPAQPRFRLAESKRIVPGSGPCTGQRRNYESTNTQTKKRTVV